ncbi:hypothetical protein [Streptomyces sp. NPDC085466]|uniref:hypothetical protein n=1 Tax=Streptomyces sp. NPDC085466 TaxID=3365725 RepID=UPI0037CD748F
MDLETLRQGNFGSLSQAITARKGVVDKLKKLETDARDDLKAKADKANWAGANATVSRSFITKTAGEFSDAHTQAQSIHDILKDTHDELVSYQQQLEQALERGRKKNLTVTPIPGGFTVTMLIHPDRAAKGHDVPDHTPQDAEHLRDDVERVLNRATESDSTAATVLRALVDQAETGFSGAKYGDRDTAIDALRKAEEAAKLLKEKGDEMSPEEFQKLNGLLASYKNDPLFQEKFATQVGPKAMLEFWADLSSPDNPNELTRTLDRTQLNQLGEFQKNLGAVLGGATQSDSSAMRQWENDMVRLSGERYKTRGAEVYGYQIMSNLMRTGDYDDQFLNKYGNQLVETEEKMRVPGNYYQGMGQMMPKMNFIGDDDFGRDPMTGFMTALSNSPDAATEFFNTTEPQDNAKWVLKERPSFDDSPLKDGPNEALDATGKAMFAAVSGMADPKADGATFVEHTDAHRDALKRSMQFLSEEGDDFPPELRDDMAWALGNHGETVHKVMSDPLGSKELDDKQLLEVSKQISRNKDSYALLNEQMNYAILADINTEKENPEDSLLNAGSTVGFLEQARQLTINADESKDLRDTSWDQRWSYHIVGGIANPFGGDWAQRGVDVITAAWAEEESKRIGEKATEERQLNSTNRNMQLEALANRWQEVNGDWAAGREGFSDRGVDRQIRWAADHGNDKVDRVGGES